MTEVGEPVGRREQNKRAKLEAIREAAQALFLKQGFEATTTAQVAAKAEVAKGTVFLYAPDKAELLFLVMHDRLQSAVQRRAATMPAKASTVAKLLHLFRGPFEAYRAAPDLARDFVRALPGATGPQAVRVNLLTFTFLQQLAEVVAQGQRTGDVATSVDPHRAARSAFSLYFMTLFAWLSGQLALEDAVDGELGPALELLHRGLKP